MKHAPRMKRAEAIDRLVSGRDRGLGAGLLRTLLYVASWFYTMGLGLRDCGYRFGLMRVARAELPVVSIGNLTTGGTGKTPFAAWVARWFRNHGVRVCFLSRGYGAEPGSVNDEALVLEQLCPDVPHLQHPERAASAKIAKDELDSQLLILDDGFQHRRLARDLDIVLVDALNPWGYGHVLPRGLLREPLSALKRASLIVITRVDQVAAEVLEEIRRQIGERCPECDLAEVSFPAECLISASGQTRTLDSFKGRAVAAFCGIGNPDAFRRSLESCGMQVKEFRQFPDHHGYSRADVEELQQWAGTPPVDAVVTTQKDLVKLGIDSLGDRPLWAIQIGTRVTRGADAIDRKLRSILEEIVGWTASPHVTQPP